MIALLRCSTPLDFTHVMSLKQALDSSKKLTYGASCSKASPGLSAQPSEIQRTPMRPIAFNDVSDYSIRTVFVQFEVSASP